MAALINVCGASFSGTTMLDLMLSNAHSAFSCGEAYSWFRPWRTHHFRIQCSCGSAECPWEHLKELPDHSFHRGVVERLGVDFVVDSAKDLCWVADSQEWARRAGLNVFNILIWKEPVELAYSYWKRTGSLTTWRRQFLLYHNRFFSLGLPHFTVRLNDLQTEPSSCLQSICDKVDMPYFAGKAHFWAKTHHHLFGSLGTREQMERGFSRISDDPDFEAGYIEHYDRIARGIAVDHSVQAIVARLHKAEVPGTGSKSDSQSSIRPIWYYLKRSKGLLRRYFPEQAQPSWR